MPETTTRRVFRWLLVGFVLLTLAACDQSAETAGGTLESSPSPNLGQGGAQDFGLFRDLVEAGRVPGPETLDDVGFFNEHRIDQPPADCGQDVCLHARLGVMGNMLDGSNCTLLQLGLNTPLSVEDLPRRPLHLVVAIDTSGSMAGEPMQFVDRGLKRMLEGLEPEDRVTLLSYDTVARPLIEHAAADSAELLEAIGELRAQGKTNIYDGLRRAYELALAHASDEVASRVVLLSDGQANQGVDETARIVRMSASYASLGVGLTTIGLGTDFDVELMRTLSETASGNFYFVENPQALEEVFTEEVDTAFVPVAEDVRIRFDVGDGYRLGGIFGTHLSSLGEDTGWIEIPSLYLAHRLSAADVGKGRRGGGGAILLELLPVPNAAPPDPNRIGELTMTWRAPGVDGADHSQRLEIRSPLAPGETPAEGLFDAFAVEKGFVMLNVFVGLRLASALAAGGDDASALDVLRGLGGAVDDWLAGRGQGDVDIADDLEVIDQLAGNLVQRGATELPPDFRTPAVRWPYD